MPKKERDTNELPSALERIDSIRRNLTDQKSIGVFLDYDGTLTPIVERPEDAVISDRMQDIVKRLAARCVVAVISGRDLKDVRDRMGLEDIYYSGSHGFEIAGPRDWYEEYPEAKAFLPVLDRTEEELHCSLDRISCIIEGLPKRTAGNWRSGCRHLRKNTPNSCAFPLESACTTFSRRSIGTRGRLCIGSSNRRLRIPGMFSRSILVMI